MQACINETDERGKDSLLYCPEVVKSSYVNYWMMIFLRDRRMYNKWYFLLWWNSDRWNAWGERRGGYKEQDVLEQHRSQPDVRSVPHPLLPTSCGCRHGQRCSILCSGYEPQVAGKSKPTWKIYCIIFQLSYLSAWSPVLLPGEEPAGFPQNIPELQRSQWTGGQLGVALHLHHRAPQTQQAGGALRGKNCLASPKSTPQYSPNDTIEIPDTMVHSLKPLYIQNFGWVGGQAMETVNTKVESYSAMELFRTIRAHHVSPTELRLTVLFHCISRLILSTISLPASKPVWLGKLAVDLSGISWVQLTSQPAPLWRSWTSTSWKTRKSGWDTNRRLFSTWRDVKSPALTR